MGWDHGEGCRVLKIYSHVRFFFVHDLIDYISKNELKVDTSQCELIRSYGIKTSAPAGSFKLRHPPTTTTFPFSKSVAVCAYLDAIKGAVVVNAPAAGS